MAPHSWMLPVFLIDDDFESEPSAQQQSVSETAVVEEPRTQDPRPPASERPLRGGPPGSGGGPPGIHLSPGSSGPRAHPGRRGRSASPEELDLFIKVAGELNPKWQTRLEELRETNQEGFQKAVGSSRRLWRLVDLHQRWPSLYKLRVLETKNEQQLKDLGRGYREAMQSEDLQGAEDILEQLRVLALAQVDLQVRVRGEELAAMAEALEQLRVEMIGELEQRSELAEELVQKHLNPPPRPEEHSGDGSRQQLRLGPESGSSKKRPSKDS